MYFSVFLILICQTLVVTKPIEQRAEMKSPAFKISLSIIPPFSPRDVEVCHIERLVFSTKFDLVFVFKNIKKQFYKVKDISLTSLEGVKDQLSSLAIKYTDGLPGCSFQESKTV